jgi:PhnB protein
MTVNAIPAGYSMVSPYLIGKDAAKMIELLVHAFGATERFRSLRPDGTVGHAEVQIGESIIMIAEAGPEAPAMPATIHVYVPDVDAAYGRALAAGAASIREPSDQFYGDRNAGVKDHAGNHWWIATHKEDLSPEEIQRRAAQEAH